MRGSRPFHSRPRTLSVGARHPIVPILPMNEDGQGTEQARCGNRALCAIRGRPVSNGFRVKVGGIGSGNHGARYNTLFVDDCAVLRVWALQRDGLLVPGQQVTGSVHLERGFRVMVDVDATQFDRGVLEIGDDRICLSTSPGTKGGLRWWFHCPSTGERIAALYRHPRIGRFMGRNASRLRYRSAYLGDHRVSVRRAQKALRRLAGPGYSGPPTRDVWSIPRPPGRWWRTHHAYRLRALRALQQADEQLLLAYNRVLGR